MSNNWARRKIISYTPEFRIDVNNPTNGFLGAGVYEKYAHTDSGDISLCGMNQAGVYHIYNDQTIEIIGGGGNQAGEISSSIDVLKTDFLSKYNYQFVGVAGHPEGSPDISNENLDLAIKQKNDFAKNVDFKMYLATQFFFEAKSLIDWEKHLVKIGNKLPIHAGIPGPASIKTLVNYARSCGIGNSLRFITKQAFNLTKLATLSTPDKLIYDLAEHSEINKDSKLEKIHFYAFGGMKKTSEWLNQFNNSDFSYNNKQKFELN